MSASDKLAQDLTKQVLKVLKDETEELKHLIAQTALENGDDETKQKMKLFKKFKVVSIVCKNVRIVGLKMFYSFHDLRIAVELCSCFLILEAFEI